ncbi:unnamed protein product [Caenorhabditis brenneri]
MSTRQQNAIENLHNEVKALRSDIAEIKKNQEEFVKNKEENGRKRKRDEDGESSSAKKPAPVPEKVKSNIPDTDDSLTANSGQLTTKTYKFELKHVFKNVSKMVENIDYNGSTEEYYSIPWYISIKRMNDYLAVYFNCDRQNNEKEWSIDADYKIHVFHPNGNSVCKTSSYCFKKASGWGWHTFMTWETMKKEYLVNDELIVEVRVEKTKTSGIYEENLRNFDDEECSDVALVVNDRKFRVAKLYLSSHSPYFKSLFLSSFKESKQSEVKLNGIDADDLQKYLEALYGEDAIDELTVEGILQLADMYVTKILIQKCEKFLLESSTKTLKKKIEMAVSYHLSELKNKCLSEIKTIEDIRSVVPECIEQMDPSVMGALFKKTLSLV